MGGRYLTELGDRPRSTSTKQAGYDLLEFSLHDSFNMDVDADRAELEAVPDCRWPARAGSPSTPTSRARTPRSSSAGAELLADSLQITHRLGGTHFTGALYSALGKYGHPLTTGGRANVVGVLRDLSGQAAELDMTLGLEICNRYETNVINTAADALRLADDIGADNVADPPRHVPHEHRGG